MMRRLLTGAGLAVLLAAPAVHAQTPDSTPTLPTPPAAPPVSPAPSPSTTPTPPASTAPSTAASDSATPPNSAPPAPKKSNRFRIGPEIGLFLPTSSKTRDQFGSSSVSLGLGIGSIARLTPKGTLALDLQVLYQTKNGNHLFLAPIGIGYRKALSQSGPNTVYAGITADLYLADLRSADYNVHSGVRTGFGGSPLLGVDFGDSGFLEARYLIVSKIKGFDLSGLNLSAGYRF